MATKYGKTFKATKGRHKGKQVRYAYKNGRKGSRRLVLARRK